MDYSQFLYMSEELSLLAVITILFLADLFMCPDKKSGKGVYNTCLPVVLLGVHTVLNLLPCCAAGEVSAFGGMYLHTIGDKLLALLETNFTLILLILKYCHFFFNAWNPLILVGVKLI